jgi:hypothetical protein
MLPEFPACYLSLPYFAFTQQADKAGKARQSQQVGKAITQEVRQASKEGIRQVSQAKRQQVNGGAGRQMNKKICGWLGGLMNGGSNLYNYYFHSLHERK